MQKMFTFLKRHRKKAIVLSVAILLGGLPVGIVQHQKQKIYPTVEVVDYHEVAIVFGAGVKDDGTPADMLKDRLLTVTELYDAGKIGTILVSGDNSVAEYNEPDVMADYLISTLGIPAEDVIRDYAGRRTYDTCIRAHEVWGIEEALLITQGYHLPRALLTCTHLGIESVGYSATRQPYIKEVYFKFRELIAIDKALWDLYIWAPDYIE